VFLRIPLFPDSGPCRGLLGRGLPCVFGHKIVISEKGLSGICTRGVWNCQIWLRCAPQVKWRLSRPIVTLRWHAILASIQGLASQTGVARGAPAPWKRIWRLCSRAYAPLRLILTVVFLSSFRFSHEFSRGVVFKLIAVWDCEIVTASARAPQSDGQEYPNTFLHLSFGKAGTS